MVGSTTPKLPSPFRAVSCSNTVVDSGLSLSVDVGSSDIVVVRPCEINSVYKSGFAERRFSSSGPRVVQTSRGVESV